MKKVADFIKGPFSSIDEGLWQDEAGEYSVGGEMPLTAKRVKEMDSAGELEWLSDKSVQADLPSEDTQDKILAEPSLEAQDINAEAAGEKKKSSKLLIVAGVVAVAIIAVSAILFFNQQESQEQNEIVIEIEDSNLHTNVSNEEVPAISNDEDDSTFEVLNQGSFTDFTFNPSNEFMPAMIIELGMLGAYDRWYIYGTMEFTSEIEFEIWTFFLERDISPSIPGDNPREALVGVGEIEVNDETIVFNYHLFEENLPFFEISYSFRYRLANGVERAYEFDVLPAEAFGTLTISTLHGPVEFDLRIAPAD